MAARPQAFSLTHLVLLTAGLLAGAVAAMPAAAQTVIGGQSNGSVQVNLDALNQLDGYAAPAGRGAVAGGYPAISGRPPLPGEAMPPRPLLGETGGRSAAAAERRRPARESSPAVAVAPAEPAPVKKPAPAPKTEMAMPKPKAAEPALPAAPAATGTTAAPPAQPVAQPPAPAGQPMSTTPPAVAAATPAPAPAPAAPTAAPAAPAASAPAPVANPAPQQMAAAPAAPKPAPANPASQQSAMVAPKPAPAPSMQGGVVSIPFAAEQAELPQGNVSALDTLAQQLAGTEDRVQIRAYAASTGTDGGSGARRLSLSRALAVRAYLIDKGIRSTRIDVRALGTPTDGSPSDRVEIAPVGR